MDMRNIVAAIRAGNVRVTLHADEEMEKDGLSYHEVCHSVLHGEIIERYPDYKPYPGCLIFGLCPSAAPVHSVWAYNSSTCRAALITVYRPDPERWINWRTRVFQ